VTTFRHAPDEVLIPVPTAALHPAHRALHELEQQARRNGGFLAPPLRRLKETLALAAVSVAGHDPRTPADIVGRSEGRGEAVPEPLSMTTATLATRLGVSTRQARRIAAAAGLERDGIDRWPTDTAKALIAQRRNARAA
jgi:hypothetical protein